MQVYTELSVAVNHIIRTLTIDTYPNLNTETSYLLTNTVQNVECLQLTMKNLAFIPALTVVFDVGLMIATPKSDALVSGHEY